MHSLELVCDADTEAALREGWAALRAAGIGAPPPAARPHVTLVVAPQIHARVDTALEPLGAPLDAVIGAPMLFGRAPFTLVRAIVPSAALLALHTAVYRRAAPYLVPAPLPLCAPGQWTPHVTLARRVAAAQLGRAVAGARRDGPARFVGLRRWDGDRRVEHPL